jgi:hypothetical protein
MDAARRVGSAVVSPAELSGATLAVTGGDHPMTSVTWAVVHMNLSPFDHSQVNIAGTNATQIRRADVRT